MKHLWNQFNNYALFIFLLLIGLIRTCQGISRKKIATIQTCTKHKAKLWSSSNLLFLPKPRPASHQLELMPLYFWAVDPFHMQHSLTPGGHQEWHVPWSSNSTTSHSSDKVSVVCPVTHLTNFEIRSQGITLDPHISSNAKNVILKIKLNGQLYRLTSQLTSAGVDQYLYAYP